MTRFAHPRAGLLNLFEIGNAANAATPEIAGDSLRLSQAPDVVGQNETSGIDVAFDRRQISGKGQLLCHIGHHLHQPDRALPAHGPGSRIALDEKNGNHQKGVKPIASATAQDSLDDAPLFFPGKRRISLVQMRHESRSDRRPNAIGLLQD